MKFRRKTQPDIVAEQWFPGRELPGVIMYKPPDAVIGNRNGTSQRFPQKPYPAVRYQNGAIVRLKEGDWVVYGEDGHQIVIDNVTMKLLYDRIEEAQTDQQVST